MMLYINKYYVQIRSYLESHIVYLGKKIIEVKSFVQTYNAIALLHFGEFAQLNTIKEDIK